MEQVCSSGGFSVGCWFLSDNRSKRKPSHIDVWSTNFELFTSRKNQTLSNTICYLLKKFAVE